MRKGWGVVIACALCATLSATPAEAAFPGANGKIAFSSNRDGNYDIWIMNPDGSGQTRLTSTPEDDLDPAWSPDGTRIAFTRDDPQPLYYSEQLIVMNADGSAQTQYAADSSCNIGMLGVTWSPDGSTIAFDCIWEEECCSGGGSHLFYLVDADGQNLRPVAREVPGPDWSPDGTRLAYNGPNTIGFIRPDGTGRSFISSFADRLGAPSWSPDASRLAIQGETFGDPYIARIYTIKPDGSDPIPLTDGSLVSLAPSWSSDGSKVAFTAGNPGSRDIHSVGVDGTGETPLTNAAGNDIYSAWQPIPINAYPRPAGAYPMRVSLVPAYEPCSSPNRTHGPPLGFGSCNPPTQQPGQLTVGTPDANGQGAKSVGSVRVTTLTGNPATPADEADVRVRANITDVRLRSDLSDYTGELEARLRIQITDKNNTPHPSGPGAATVQELTVSHQIPCAGTAGTSVGSTCQLDTTVEALLPGAVVEKRRAIWELGAIRVHDGAGNLFMTQGLFVP